MAKVVWGFPGVGKSFISDKEIIDADCRLFRWHGVAEDDLHGGRGGYFPNPDYPQNYIDYVKKSDADLVLINCHISLLHHFDDVVLVYPDVTLKEEYLKRYRNRGDHESFIAYMAEEFEGLIKVIEKSSYQKYKITKKNLFLKDLLVRKGALRMEFLNQELVRMTKNNMPHEMSRLIEEGADVNYKDKFGVPVLHWATNHANSHTIELLVDRGADVNVQNHKGVTKLMLEASYGDVDIVSYLLERGADARLKDCEGRDALSYAMEGLRFHEDVLGTERSRYKNVIGMLESAIYPVIATDTLDWKIAGAIDRHVKCPLTQNKDKESLDGRG